jgi:hypothetical protein
MSVLPFPAQDDLVRAHTAQRDKPVVCKMVYDFGASEATIFSKRGSPRSESQ